MSDVARIVCALVSSLPAESLLALQRALADGHTGLGRLRASASTSRLRDSCQQVIDAIDAGTSADYVLGALEAAQVLLERERQTSVEVVWSGPDSAQPTSRLTLAAVTDLIADATQEVLLVSYAAHNEQRLAAALTAAVDRGVHVTLLLERSADNPAYHGSGTPFASLDAKRLIWPAEHRAAGASLHAKLLLVDRKVALIGSANLTSRALDSNLELGVLIRDREVCQQIHAHLAGLQIQGLIQRLSSQGHS